MSGATDIHIDFRKCEKCGGFYMTRVNGVSLCKDDLHLKCPHPAGENQPHVMFVFDGVRPR